MEIAVGAELGSASLVHLAVLVPEAEGLAVALLDCCENP